MACDHDDHPTVMVDTQTGPEARCVICDDVYMETYDDQGD